MTQCCCMDCDAPLPQHWPAKIGNDNQLCASCEDRRWYYFEQEQAQSEDDAYGRSCDE